MLEVNYPPSSRSTDCDGGFIPDFNHTQETQLTLQQAGNPRNFGIVYANPQGGYILCRVNVGINLQVAVATLKRLTITGKTPFSQPVPPPNSGSPVQ